MKMIIQQKQRTLMRLDYEIFKATILYRINGYDRCSDCSSDKHSFRQAISIGSLLDNIRMGFGIYSVNKVCNYTIIGMD